MAGRAGDQTPEAVWRATAVATVQDLAGVLRQLRRSEARQRGDSPLTYRELAARTGWSYSIISEYFAGTVLAPTDRFDVLVRLLGASQAEQRALATARDRVEERGRRRQPTGRAVADVPPRQLPADVNGFTGRTAQLADLDALLTHGRPPSALVICAVTGTAGVGKTAIAVHWAHRVRGRFPDGQLYVNLRGFDPAGSPMNPAEAVRLFLDAFAVPPDRMPVSLDAQEALYRSLLADRRVLVVLDNARDAGQVRPLLPGAPGCLAVVTSRNQLTSLVAGGAHRIQLEPLPTAEALDLMTRRLGAARVAGEPDAVDTIVASCVCLPLALTVVAARAAAHPRFPLQALAAELRRSRGAGLDAFDRGDPAADVRAVFSWSYHALSVHAAGLFRLLGLHPGPDLGAAAAASLAGIPIGQVRPLLAELAGVHLIEEHSPGRYGLHDLLRAYAAELAGAHDPAAERTAAVHRMLDHYLHTAYAADRLLNPQRDPITLSPPRPDVTPEAVTDRGQAMAWFTAEHRVLLAVVERAAGARFDSHGWQLPWTLADFFHLRGHYRDLATTQSAALRAARRLGDLPGQAHTHRSLASAYDGLGRYDDARAQLEQAIGLYGELGDHTGQAHTHLNLGSVLGRQGRHRDALEHAQRALDLYRAAQRRAWQARSLDAIGWLHAQLGDHERALTYCEQALTLHQEVGDRHGEAETWDSLGYAHHHLGRHQQAVACYQHAVDLYRDLGDRFNEAGTLSNLGDTHHAAGNPGSARVAWQGALAILDELGHTDACEVRAKLRS